MKRFLANKKFNNITKNESDIQRVYNYPMFTWDSKIYSIEGFVIIVDVSMSGSHWAAFYVEINESLYFDSFGGHLDNFLLIQLPKPKPFNIYETRDNISHLWGSHCLYFFYLIEKVDLFDAISIMYFAK